MSVKSSLLLEEVSCLIKTPLLSLADYPLRRMHVQSCTQQIYSSQAPLFL